MVHIFNGFFIPSIIALSSFIGSDFTVEFMNTDDNHKDKFILKLIMNKAAESSKQIPAISIEKGEIETNRESETKQRIRL
ncbi:12242_t:CDS:2 [Funneliformis caledonium]|uniref:12242_t:CDS:1 n=1 Tax=Funneliformis caledonium TaxID=1117310 RepID=A0A9N8WG20_9GLOM|nr:12242_t:CDS:2 [Funneliformis caledonium]